MNYLFRGTKPTVHHDWLFRTDGLLSRIGNNGEPGRITALGALWVVQEHLLDRRQNERSPFLSFSKAKDVALRYAWMGYEGEPVPCTDYEERAIVFQLDVSAMTPLDAVGMYRLEYNCDYANIKPNGPSEDEARSAELASCDFCDGDQKVHVLQLIHVTQFLAAYRVHGVSDEARRRAHADDEWLAYPTDFIPRLRGFSARIPPSAIWTYELFK